MVSGYKNSGCLLPRVFRDFCYYLNPSIVGTISWKTWRTMTICWREFFTFTFLAPPIIFPYNLFPGFFNRFFLFRIDFFFDKAAADMFNWGTFYGWLTDAVFFTLYLRKISAYFMGFIFTNFFTYSWKISQRSKKLAAGVQIVTFENTLVNFLDIG